MTKILAKTKGYVLSTGNFGEFLDGLSYHVVEYDNVVRNWENRGLIAEKFLLEGNPTDEEFKALGKDKFLKKYKANKTQEEKKQEALETKEEEALKTAEGNAKDPEEPKVEEPKVEEPKVEEPKVEEPKVEKNKGKTSEKKEIDVID